MGEISSRREEEESLRWQKAGVTWQKVSVMVAIIVGFFTVWGVVRSQGTAAIRTYRQEADSNDTQIVRVPVAPRPATAVGSETTPPACPVQRGPIPPSLPGLVVTSRPPSVQVPNPPAVVIPRAPLPVPKAGSVSLSRDNATVTDGTWYHSESPMSIGGKAHGHSGRSDTYAIFDIGGWDRFTATAGIQDSNGPCAAHERSKVLIAVDGRTVKTCNLYFGREGESVSIPLSGKSRLKIICFPGAVLAEPNLVKE